MRARFRAHPLNPPTPAAPRPGLDLNSYLGPSAGTPTRRADGSNASDGTAPVDPDREASGPVAGRSACGDARCPASRSACGLFSRPGRPPVARRQSSSCCHGRRCLSCVACRLTSGEPFDYYPHPTLVGGPGARACPRPSARRRSRRRPRRGSTPSGSRGPRRQLCRPRRSRTTTPCAGGVASASIGSGVTRGQLPTRRRHPQSRGPRVTWLDPSRRPNARWSASPRRTLDRAVYAVTARSVCGTGIRSDRRR